MKRANLVGFPRCGSSSFCYALIQDGYDVYYFDGPQYTEPRFYKYYKTGINFVVTRNHKDWLKSWNKIFSKPPNFTQEQRLEEMKKSDIMFCEFKFADFTKLIPNIPNENKQVEEARKKAFLEIQRND